MRKTGSFFLLAGALALAGAGCQQQASVDTTAETEAKTEVPTEVRVDSGEEEVIMKLDVKANAAIDKEIDAVFDAMNAEESSSADVYAESNEVSAPSAEMNTSANTSYDIQ